MSATTETPPVWRYWPASVAEIPLLVSIPHTGTFVPAEIVAQFAHKDIAAQLMTDWALHELYTFLPALGVDVIHATHHRFVIDLNRPPDARPLYPGRFETGLVPTESFQGEPIWRRSPSATEVGRRLERFHRPYHAALEQRLREKVARFGYAYLIDAHSVESRASRLHGALNEDIYLGDRDRATCDPAFTARVSELFAAQGLQVSVNEPYKGGYITAHYCSLAGVQSLQIEMCQRLYMTEGQPERASADPRFAPFQQHLRLVFAGIAEIVRTPPVQTVPTRT
ncbi:MAG TPA: N-formylglutamate amidohydrolase [Steroidobacteraceae bacterium]|nr:N-formylglutamate amidohydrolase [Steroidobacteraceae bacterium]